MCLRDLLRLALSKQPGLKRQPSHPHTTMQIINAARRSSGPTTHLRAVSLNSLSLVFSCPLLSSNLSLPSLRYNSDQMPRNRICRYVQSPHSSQTDLKPSQDGLIQAMGAKWLHLLPQKSFETKPPKRTRLGVRHQRLSKALRSTIATSSSPLPLYCLKTIPSQSSLPFACPFPFACLLFIKS